MKKVVILQSNYIPWKGYFDLIHDADVFVFYDEVKYTKNDWRNRNIIYTKNGEQWLTIPIHKDAVKQKISEVMISDPSWQELHYKTLSLTYKKCPYYSQLEPLLEELYVSNKWDNLSKLNHYSIQRISSLLGIKTQFIDSGDMTLNGDRVERLVNLLKDLDATDYISGPSAKDYIGQDFLHLFEDAHIRLSYKDYSGYPLYKQLRDPFLNGVSILDMIAQLSWDDIRYHIWGWREK